MQGSNWRNMSDSKKYKIATTAILAVEIEIDCDGYLTESSTEYEKISHVKSSQEMFDIVSAFGMAVSEIRKIHPNIKACWTPIMDVEKMKEI